MIRVEHVSKTFRRGRTRALDDVTLHVDAGDALAIVGPNGAGKSTLLRLIAGVGAPDAGTIAVDGAIGTLLELGVGFHDEATGRESALLTAIVAGLGRRAARARLDDIVAFAELERVIDQPVRTYSAGMRARLAFAVAVHVDADVLVVDEALAVGDLAFRDRCIDRIRSLRAGGVTLVLATHELDLAADMCDRAVWLGAGRVVAEGPAAEIGSRYATAVRRAMEASTPIDVRDQPGRWGTQRVVLVDIVATDAIATGGAIHIAFGVVPRDVTGPVHLAVSIGQDDVVLFDTATTVEVDGERLDVTLEVDRLDLRPGRYWLDVGAYDADWDERYDYHHARTELTVAGSAGSGLLAPPHRWGLEPRSTSEGVVWAPRSSTSS